MIRKSKEMARTPEIINDLAFHASQVLIESINLDSSSAENVGFAIADRMKSFEATFRVSLMYAV